MTNSSSHVLVLGDACVDLIVQIPEQSGNAREQKQPELHGGGTGANTAVGLARLGIATGLMGTIGHDGYGSFTRNTLIEAGVDTTHLHAIDDVFTTITLALIDPHGERTLYGWPRRGAAHNYFDQTHLDASAILAADWVHTTGLCLVEPPARDAILAGLEVARSAGIPTSMDLNLRLGFESGALPNPFRRVIEQAMTLCDFVFGSAMDEFSYLAPAAMSAPEIAQHLAADRLTVVARLAEQGALLAQPGQAVFHAPAFAVPNVVDTLGAGDTFNAGFIAACVEGHSPPVAMQWGNAAAALKVQKRGARNTPSRAELNELLAG